MANENEAPTVEVPEVSTSSEPTPMSKEEATAEGLTPAEIERAEKAGLLRKPEEKPKEPGQQPAPAAPATGQPQGAKPPEPPAKPATSIPDAELTPEQEKVFLQTFGAGHPTRGLYFRMKNERQARQRVERDSKAEIDALKARLAVLEKPGETKPPVDPKAPLTEERLREIRNEEARAELKAQEENAQRMATLKAAQSSQEEYMRGERQDFDKTVELAIDLIKNADALLATKAQRTRAGNLYRMLQQASAKADTFDVEEYNAAHIAYELGQMHPKYGQKADGTGSPEGEDPMPGKEDGKLTPEQMARAEQRAQKGVPSAAVSGGSRKVPVADVTAEMLIAMNYKQRDAFKRDHPKRYAEILEG